MLLQPEMRVGEVGEMRLVEHLRSRVPGGPGVVVGIGDDAAALETGPLTLVTTDSLVEDVHFRREWTPWRLLGRKVLSINLSDIGSMGGVPRFATVSLALPGDLPVGFLDGLYDGMLERAAETGVTIVGGNIARTNGPVTIDVTLLGLGDHLLCRSGAQPGDLLVVTGALGASAEGLQLLRQGARLTEDGHVESTGLWTESSAPAVLRCLRAHLDPSPPLAFARGVAEHEVARAGLDLSDGLSGDLVHLCEASEVGALVDTSCIPVDPAVVLIERARGGDALERGLHGGEDYELLLAVAPERLDAMRDLAVIWDLPLTVIGTCTKERPGQVWLHTPSGTRPCPARSHDHFRAWAAEQRASALKGEQPA